MTIKKNLGSNSTYSSKLTTFLVLLIPLAAICDSSFFLVRNEPRICLQKSVIFVCKGRATYSNGFQILDCLFIGLNCGVNLKTYLRIYALKWFLTSNSCLQRLRLLIVGECRTGICGGINYFRLATFKKVPQKDVHSDHQFSTAIICNIIYASNYMYSREWSLDSLAICF